MAGKSTKDLTEGSPLKLILGFAVPLIGGMLFQQLYSMVDTMIVGRALGVEALAGVGSTGSVNFMILGFCQGTCTGFSVPIAQKFGAKDEKGLRRFVANSIYLAAAMAVIVTLAVTLLLRQILTWMNTPENVFDYAYGYIFIIFLGIPTIILYNLASGIIRALGDSRAPVVFLVIASGMNIAGDLFLMLVLRMGVAGAALATVISQLFSGILSLIYIYRKIPVLRLGREDMRPDPGIMRTLVTMGVPMGLQFSVTAIGSVILQTAVNGLGSVYVATMTAAARVSFFFNVPLEAMGSTMATYTGQNIGAKRLDRLTAGLKDASILGLSYCAAAYLVLIFLGTPMVSLFISGADSAAILAAAKTYLRVNGAFMTALLYVLVLRSMIQGMGYSGLSILSGMMEMFARVFVALAVIPALGFFGACFSNPFAWLAADLFLTPAYVILFRRVKSRFASA